MLAVKNLTGNTSIFGRDFRLMGTHFSVRLVTNDAFWANGRIDAAIAEISRVEKLLSTFTEDSIINQINRNAGIKPVYVGGEVFRLIQRALQISTLTYGTFDIIYHAPSTGDGGDAIKTSTKTLKKKLSLTNYTNVILDEAKQTVFLKNTTMRIGTGSISRGYAADRAKFVLQMMGVKSGVINADGDLLTWGSQPDNEPWTIASADPSMGNMPYAGVNISNMAVATSYNTKESEPVSKNRKKGDIDPENGFPVSHIKSVSIITPTAELADAMATPVIAMGVNAGLYLINKLNQMACIIVDDQDRIYTSKDLHKLV